MFAKLICLSAVVALSFSTTCVPDQPNFYWSTPCEGVTNLFVPTSIQAYQNNQTLDSQGGIDARIDLNVQVTIQNNYDKTITNPLVDIAIQEYSETLGKCKWNNVPTLGLLDNQDTCQFMANCHMDNPPDPTQFTVTVNIAQLAGSLVGILKNQTYYGIDLTFKDGKTDKLACAYIQDKLINY